MLYVQKFLRSFGAVDYYTPATIPLDKLKEKYAIDYKFHSDYPNVVLLKYSQIESPFKERIVQECRGLILDAANNWNVVACPFFKFFNISQPLAAEIDWKTAKVQEKVDGSLLVMWWYDDRWHVSTSGWPDGTNQVDDSGITFGELFWDTFEKQSLDIENFSRWNTYMFELTSPLNRVVVDHKDAKLTLIGIRSLHPYTPLEEQPLDSDGVGIDIHAGYRVKEYPLSNLEECLSAAGKLNPLEQEGYVVVDAGFNRVKIKSPAYVAIHHLKDSCSLSKMAEVIRNGEYQEFLVALDSYPIHKERFLGLVARYEDAIKTCTELFENIKDIENQKEFAAKACQTPYSTVLFAMRKNKLSAAAVIKNMLTNSYLRLLGVKE